MPQRAATIEGLSDAFEVVKAIQTDGLNWGEEYRALGKPWSLSTARMLELRSA